MQPFDEGIFKFEEGDLDTAAEQRMPPSVVPSQSTPNIRSTEIRTRSVTRDECEKSITS